MREISPAEALGALKDAFGRALETTHERGLRLMRDRLTEAFDITGSEADDVLTALQRGKSITWVEATEGPLPPPAVPPFAESPLTSAPQNAPVYVPLEGGYWRIGEGG